MADYIDRQEVIETLAFYREDPDGIDHALNSIKNIPSADVAPMEWIPVTERLPEQNGKYLAFALEEENTMDFYDEHWMLCGTDYRHYVTHWMPLPKPPVLN